MQMKGCLIAAGATLAVFAAAAAVFLPPLLRQGGRMVRPITEMKAAGREFKAFEEAHPWKRPAVPTLSAEQLDRFLAVRRELAKLDKEAEGKLDGLAGGKKPSLAEMPDIMEGMSGVVSGEMKAYVQGNVTPAEYRYVERLVYRTWWSALRKAGGDPGASRRAAAEIDAAAANERGSVAARLREVAATLRGHRPEPPPGISSEIHDLLLARMSDIEELAEERTGPMRQQW